MNAEIWKPVIGYEAEYEVSNSGKVRSLDTIQRRSNGRTICNFKIKGKILKPYKTGRNGGYLTVSIHGKNHKVHRLVAEAFIPNPDNLPQVNHIDGNKNNNTIENLEWVTNLENMRHAFETGLHLVGENVYNSKLTAEQVKAIREEYTPKTRGKGAKSLAKKYGVSDITIRNIIKGRKWKHDVHNSG